MLGWFLRRLREHYSGYIAFMDFGVSPKTREAYQHEFTYWIDESRLTGSCSAWFLKPLAMHNSPFNVSLWLDVDIETCKPVYPVFKRYGGCTICMTEDVPSNHLPARQFNTGCVMFTDKARDLLMRWWRVCGITPPHFRSDQEAFESIASPSMNVVTPFDDGVQWLRCKPSRRTTVFRHYTGIEGHDMIRQMINNEVRE